MAESQQMEQSLQVVMEHEVVQAQLSEMLDGDLMKSFRENMAPIRALMSRYRCAMMEVETKFKVLNEQFSLEHDRNRIESIKTRLKSMDSIFGEAPPAEAAHHPVLHGENLNDVAGVRVICSFVDDIYVLVDCLLRQDDVTLLQVKDYIKHPKANGYRSLHLIISIPIFLQEETHYMKVEVQLRTIAMDFWASLEHQMRYKKNLDPAGAAKLAADLGECADISAMLDQRMQDIKNHIEGNRDVPSARNILWKKFYGSCRIGSCPGLQKTGGICPGGGIGSPITSGSRKSCCSKPVWRLYAATTPVF